MRSSEGEIVLLTITINTAAARGQVEKWLLELEKAMKASVHHVVALSYDDYSQIPREKWVIAWPGQAVSVIKSQINLIYVYKIKTENVSNSIIFNG